MSLAAKLAQGIAQLELTLPPQAEPRLLDYLSLLGKWNKVYNLTAVRGAPRMVSHHLLDCLAVVRHVRAATILDVGSGAGLPGIPLALALPRAQVTLLDSSHKKAAFLRQAAIELKLDNVEVACERVEAWRPARRYELVISRAFSDLSEFAALAGRLVAGGGVLAAMKGVYPYEELERLPAGYRLQRVVLLEVPGVRGSRHLVLVEPARADD
ncbi:MAG: 16S rRNA (guanine(527)-N(7))-methyltransferase RsmG [Betaproteobacteria bacterium]|nr:16S rRNA (guanine(527)-N(7))-methyltransferase RsmG [Betaproteobacteria bacterium]